MVDAVVSVFLERLLNTLAEGGRVVNGLRDQFQKLQNELDLMQCFLKDADKKKRKDHTLRAVMANLRDLIYESENLVADCQFQSREGSQFSNGWLACIYPLELRFKYRTGKRLKKIHEEITNIKQSIKSYGPLLTRLDSHKDQMPRWSSHVYDHTQVVGLLGDMKKIKDWLVNAGADVGILEIGIAGMGGLGKTTLAQMVFNDEEIEGMFERRIWVCVSQTFTEEQIMRSILRTLGDASVGDEQGELLRKINQYLSGKRYLIVMDDVWSQEVSWWDRIYEGLPKGQGSSVIITTRNVEVSRKMRVSETRIHRPEFLGDDDSWLLFRKVAFAASEGECTNPELEKVGKEIVEKCRGLPLAIKAIGGLLLHKSHYHEWKQIANNFRDELAENGDSMMTSLQLSYDELPSYLKSCLLSFSIYPEDCVITKEQLIRWWIGEGFVPSRSSRASTEAGEDCFSRLTNRCLVEAVDKTYNGTIYTCKIHDMVRDLVIKMAEDDAFFKSTGRDCRHMGINTGINLKQLAANHKLRALLSTTKTGEVNEIGSSTSEIFKKCKYLRVLDLSKSLFNFSLTSLFSQIGSLQHLTYLSFSKTHLLVQLPPSLKNLKNLQILDVSYSPNLRVLPPYITKFKKLRVLDVKHCSSLEYLPKGLGKLPNLEVLLGFKPARSSCQSDGCRISELRNLILLRELGLHLTRGDEIGDTEVNTLVNLEELQFLTISCFNSHCSDLVDKLNNLYPPPNLHDLCLRFYPSKVTPVWLNPISLHMLRFLSMSGGNLASVHEAFWGENNSVWRIEGMMLESLSDLQMEWQMVQQVMPQLRIVEVNWCPDLVSFPMEDVGFRGGVWEKGEHRS